MYSLLRTSADASPVLYVDPHRLSREAVVTLLSNYLPDMKVESLPGLDDLAGGADLGQYRLVILHTHMARVDDGKIAARLARMSCCSPAIPFLLISDVEDPDVIVEAFRHGARGYITTAQSWAETTATIRFVVSGGVATPKSLLTRADPTRAADHQPAVRLTSRQLEVLRSLQQGKPNKVIAFELGMSENTVKVHIRQIMKKLHASNRTQLAINAREILRAHNAVIPRPSSTFSPRPEAQPTR